MEKTDLLKRINESKKPYPTINGKKGTLNQFGKGYNQAMSDAIGIFADYVAENKEAIENIDEYRRFFAEKVPEYAKAVMKKKDEFNNEVYNLLDLLSTFPHNE